MIVETIFSVLTGGVGLTQTSSLSRDYHFGETRCVYLKSCRRTGLLLQELACLPHCSVTLAVRLILLKRTSSQRDKRFSCCFCSEGSIYLRLIFESAWTSAEPFGFRRGCCLWITPTFCWFRAAPKTVGNMWAWVEQSVLHQWFLNSSQWLVFMCCGFCQWLLVQWNVAKV